MLWWDSTFCRVTPPALEKFIARQSTVGPPPCHPDRASNASEWRDPFDSAFDLAQDEPMGWVSVCWIFHRSLDSLRSLGMTSVD